LNLLSNIHTPADLRGLSGRELSELCAEIREFLITNLSKTGGHLASNLGVVELTVALHLAFDFDRDRLLFDVGHQSYIHKILTGRTDKFATLRKFGGLSGFPKPAESHYDAFVAGHASNSVSAALGLARARTLRGDTHSVVALLGDGALTGGLAYEGLSDAGDTGEAMVVVLNDNGMSITRNVGGVAKYLSRQRIKPSYLTFKQRYRRFTEKIPGGKLLYRFTHRLKAAIKRAVLQCSMFEEMGFEYIGPIDGHDIKSMTRALELARAFNSPALVHVITQKGRGFTPAERSPETFHGVGLYDPETGETESGGESFSRTFGAVMCELGARSGELCAVTAAMASGTGLAPFKTLFPERFFDVGIAEGHAVTMCAGLAAGGMLPVFAVYSTFLQRGFDMLIHDVSLMRVHAIFALDRAGLVAGDGETHQGVFDVSYLSGIPGMTVFAPTSYAELCDMLSLAVNDFDSPVAIRYPKGEQGSYVRGGTDASLLLRRGSDVTLVTYGILVNDCVEAAEMLAEQGIFAEVIKLGRVCPIDFTHIGASAAKTGRCVVVEDSILCGGVGERIAASLAQLGIAAKFRLLNVGSETPPCGAVPELKRMCGLDAAGIVSAARELMR
jgi:1-deoxy-D-xylulose-5-phosphate synthase